MVVCLLALGMLAVPSAAFAQGEGEPTPVVDTDGDGTPDGGDNCPDTPNEDQANADGDAQGDACDPEPNDAENDGDRDNDGAPNGEDNCPDTPNEDQANADGDAQGDACDPEPNDAENDGDRDNDGDPNGADNCPDTANSDQANNDGDAQGNACDPQPNDAENDSDRDNDGRKDNDDNCPNNANPGQEDRDGDGLGAACDSNDNSTSTTPPADQPTPTGPVEKGGTALFGSRLKINRKWQITVPVLCTRTLSACTGRVKLSSANKVRVSRRAKAKRLSLGSASFQIKQGRVGYVKIRLSLANRRVLARFKRMYVYQTIAAPVTAPPGTKPLVVLTRVDVPRSMQRR
jgi:hypothetical protein